VARLKVYYKGGRWCLPPSPGRGESCEFMFARGLSMRQKCSKYTLTNLLFSLCRSVWVIELLVNLLSPHLGVPTHPSTPKVLQAKERPPIPSPSIVFTLGLVVESTKESRGVSNSLWTPQCPSQLEFFWIN
jgi:hypothetical protein